MKYFCNPLNVDYRYQFNQQVMPGLGEGAIEVSREAADPSMIYFKGKVIKNMQVSLIYYNPSYLCNGK